MSADVLKLFRELAEAVRECCLDFYVGDGKVVCPPRLMPHLRAFTKLYMRAESLEASAQLGEMRKLRDKLSDMHRRAQRVESEMAMLRRRVREASVEGVWIWLGDGSDDLDSMSEGMAVKIRAGDLRAMLLAERDRLPDYMRDAAEKAELRRRQADALSRLGNGEE
jgi:hypothetical protein